MLEINFDNTLFRNMRPCRRIVLEEGVDLEKIDSAWRKKLERGSGSGKRGDIILSRPQTKVPARFKVVEEIKEGEDMGLSHREIGGQEMKAVHICHGFVGFSRRGMKFKWVPVNESAVKTALDSSGS